MNRPLFPVLRLATTCLLVLAAAASANAQFIYGVDVSTYQGTITTSDWTSAKNSGIQFAYCKATEGVGFVDSQFTNNMTSAMAAGVYIAPYHFARVDSSEGATDATSEAHDFVEAIRPYYQTPGFVLRPALDLETVPNDGRAIKPYESQWVRDFMTYVQTNLGVTPIIYTNTNYATNYLESDINQYNLWLANWNYTPPNVPPASADGIFRGWNFWQYADSGTVPGIGSVDHDVYRGTLAQMLSFFQGVKPTGDVNNDGKVDGKDLLIWQRNVGRTGTAATFARGNANGDGTIDAADLAVMQAQWGTAGVASAVSAVPEPAAITLALIGALGLLRKSRQNQA